ncbi:hypothetical protein [Deinococcus sp. AJ005]|uniref:hypothetical protein n=1 Tax=Deinococcus sp. AJ005 TaxID=2652443 RepID=UPI00125CC75D|nr:hypothetical protein [Deinococcus sp. AJ005]QFP76160.1 hypothetical protein DAAJ005_06625 [Deinococcus sp. AJ005]
MERPSSSDAAVLYQPVINCPVHTMNMHLTLLPILLTSLLLGAAPQAMAGPSTAGLSIAAKVPTILSSIPAEEGIYAQVTAAQQNAGVTVLQLRGVPGGQQLPPLRVGQWPAGVQAGRLAGAVLRVSAEREPDGGSISLTLTRGGKDRPLLTLLAGVRPADPLGLGLSFKKVTASSVILQSADQPAQQRTVRPGDRVTLTSPQGKVCVQVYAIMPVRADFSERGAPPVITGYRVTLGLLTPDPATDCA